ncbi:hypothetical protein SAY87_010230 [Trapa incisa]|uniref:DOMON domain-containing protein n=1 Tax=Trapa incisa TaxID=236973 RepID=A0AAN7JI81_9MYRT|nr:hypothetical protein SAY87_010230 [Trapa incisa]
MASLSLLPILRLSLALLLVAMASPAESLTCKSQDVTDSSSGMAYANCTDLPYLGAYLHYTYNAANSSLSVAFIAVSTGWISWAINPTAQGMVGAQALMALKTENGSVVAKTFNISSYHSIVESKLSFDVWNLKADVKNGTTRLFGSVTVPADATSLNQVWQVGDRVNGILPRIHSMEPDHKKSMGTLFLAANTTASAGGGGGVTPEVARTPTPASGAPGIQKAFSCALSMMSTLLLCLMGFR